MEQHPARSARHEASERIGGAADVRVLEPSPPAVVDEWAADDPTAPPADDRAVVLPTAQGADTWHVRASADGDLAAWAADRWLGAWRRLGPLPPAYETTRAALHRVAVYVLSPARQAANGKMALRWTLHGFGTPFFGADQQLRIEHTDLVVQDAQGARRAPLGSLAAVAAAAGVELDPTVAERFDVPAMGDGDAPLDVDPAAAAALADWYGFATSVLEELRATDAAGHDPSRVQLWPEHFDPAFEAGIEADGARAGYGASPGDGWHAEPYLYVSVWDRDRLAGELADDPTFDAPFGAHLPWSTLLAADDQRAAALAFYRAALARLVG